MYDIMRFIALHENDSNTNATAALLEWGYRLKYEALLPCKGVFLTGAAGSPATDKPR